VTRLRVAIGVIAGVTGGPATYGVELVRALARLEQEEPAPAPGGVRLDLVVLTDRPDAFRDAPAVRAIALPLGSSWRQPWWDNVAVPRVLAGLGVGVYHGTKHALPLLGLPRGTQAVATIHDLAVLREPETFALAQRLQLRVHLAHAARRADRIVCDSRHAAADVAERLGVAAERIAVVPLGVAARFRPPASDAEREATRRGLGVGAGALVSFVGTAQPRKRIEVAIEAVRLLREHGRDVTLAIAGRRRPGWEPAWLASPPPFVRLLGELPEEDVVALYGASEAMVSPSTYEGFGLTFAEAMACGCPVVGVDASSVPEVVGDGGILVPRAEAGLVAEAMERLLGDADLRARTSRAARARAAQLTWERCAHATREVYLALAGLAPRATAPAGARAVAAAGPP
jgi:glycosyltransferase involved in cell wall biosynthesis